MVRDAATGRDFWLSPGARMIWSPHAFARRYFAPAAASSLGRTTVGTLAPEQMDNGSVLRVCGVDVVSLVSPTSALTCITAHVMPYCDMPDIIALAATCKTAQYLLTGHPAWTNSAWFQRAHVKALAGVMALPSDTAARMLWCAAEAATRVWRRVMRAYNMTDGLHVRDACSVGALVAGARALGCCPLPVTLCALLLAHDGQPATTPPNHCVYGARLLSLHEIVELVAFRRGSLAGGAAAGGAQGNATRYDVTPYGELVAVPPGDAPPAALHAALSFREPEVLPITAAAGSRQTYVHTRTGRVYQLHGARWSWQARDVLEYLDRATRW
ncbi:hypothetical protein EON68_01635 [archaeon]|nr:MAG: hypothetical protein EON68_01635 [archaeon]